jgi:hypothetical protein
MRRIFQFDGIDQGVLSVGECAKPEQVAICITDHAGKEAQVLINRESFRELCGLSYDIRFLKEPITEPDPCEAQQTALAEEEPF